MVLAKWKVVASLLSDWLKQQTDVSMKHEELNRTTEISIVSCPD